jgi:hypothetical protein
LTVRLLTFPIIPDWRGVLCVIEGERTVPFAIQRVYFLFDVPTNAHRAGHAHRTLEQVYIPLSGSFRVMTYDGARCQVWTLHDPAQGLYIGPGVWRDIDRFTSNAVCLVLASAEYDEADYIREMDRYRVAYGAPDGSGPAGFPDLTGGSPASIIRATLDHEGGVR